MACTQLWENVCLHHRLSYFRVTAAHCFSKRLKSTKTHKHTLVACVFVCVPCL